MPSVSIVRLKSRILKMVTIQRSGECHWVPKAGLHIRVPELADRPLILRRVIFATFRGPVFPEGDVKATCTLRLCHNPDHIEQYDRPKGRPVSSDGTLEVTPELLGEEALRQRMAGVREVNLLPKGVTAKGVAVAKNSAGPVAAVAHAAGLTPGQVVAARAGVFDKALRSTGGRRAIRDAVERRKVADDRQLATDSTELAARPAVEPPKPEERKVPLFSEGAVARISSEVDEDGDSIWDIDDPGTADEAFARQQEDLVRAAKGLPAKWS